MPLPICHLHISHYHNAPYLRPPPPPPPTKKKMHNLYFSFLLGITAIPREIENNVYAKFWGAHKVHYGRCASGVWDSFGDASASLIGFYDQGIYNVAQNWKSESKFAPHNSCTVAIRHNTDKASRAIAEKSTCLPYFRHVILKRFQFSFMAFHHTPVKAEFHCWVISTCVRTLILRA